MGLLKFLKSSEDARRIFGKRELKIIEKQMLGVNLTQSEKNRLSRDVRRKLEFIRQISGFSGEFRLKKGSEIRLRINSAKDSILGCKKFGKIKKIVLFGSAAENRLSLISDIDISVEFESISKEDAVKFRIEMSKLIDERVDVQVYNALPEKMRAELRRKGKVLYES